MNFNAHLLNFYSYFQLYFFIFITFLYKFTINVLTLTTVIYYNEDSKRVSVSLRGPMRRKAFLIRGGLFLLKEFKTIDQQIEILLDRGLIIDDINKAKEYLLTQNYYNIINGYGNFFPRDNQDN